MSIIGEMWEEDYYNLQQEHIKDLRLFANWLADNGYKSIGYNLWELEYGSRRAYCDQVGVYYTTEQLVERFKKEIKI